MSAITLVVADDQGCGREDTPRAPESQSQLVS